MATQKSMSFLPEDYIQRRVEQRTNLICLTLFGVVLIGVVGAFTVSWRQRAEVRTQQQQVNDAYEKAAQRIEQLNQLQDQKQRMLAKAQVTASLLEPVPRTFLLAELVNRMPPTLSLLELEIDSKKVSPRTRHIDRKTSALRNARKVAGSANGEKGKADPPSQPPAVPRYEVNVDIVGIAPTDVQVAQYMTALSQCPLLSDVGLVFSEEKIVEDLTMRRFRMEMQLDLQADVRQIEPLIAQRRMPRDPMKEAVSPDTEAAGGGSFLDRLWRQMPGGKD